MDEFTDRIICGDCIELLGTVREPFAELIFADPPFNIGYQYDKYKDRVKSERYIAWTEDWMGACVDVLTPTGSFYIAIGDEYAAHVRLIGEKLGLTLRNWIIWHYTFGQQTRTKFARAHTHIFYFVKDAADFVFNDFAIRVPSDRELTYNDKRADPRGKMPDDVWNKYSRLCGTFKERQGWHPCQMPELLLARIISVSSNPADLVLDPFIGSGTTAAVAHSLGRRYAGMDISENYVENVKKRLGETKKPTPRNLFTDICGDPVTDTSEELELRRLCVEIGIDVKDVVVTPKLLKTYAKQFTLRMNNGKTYKPADLLPGLKDIQNWAYQKSGT